MNNILDAALRNEKQIIADRRHIHKNPEVGFYLPDTADYVRQRLADMGIASQLCGGPVDMKTRKSFRAARVSGYESFHRRNGNHRKRQPLYFIEGGDGRSAHDRGGGAGGFCF